MNRYRSKFEESLASKLTDFTYECTKFQYVKKTNRKMVCLECEGTKVAQYAEYTTDFRLPNGVFIEAKGWFQPHERTKMASVIKHNPEADIRMVFQKDQWCTKKKKMRYSDWCIKNNIKYAVGTIPQSWISEK